MLASSPAVVSDETLAGFGFPVFPISGSGLAHYLEIVRLKFMEIPVTSASSECILTPDFARFHQVSPGRTFQVALIPGSELCQPPFNTHENVSNRIEYLGYKVPVAEFALRLMEHVTAETFASLSVDNVIIPHAHIKFPDDESEPIMLLSLLEPRRRVLCIRELDGKITLAATFGKSYHLDKCAFAAVLP